MDEWMDELMGRIDVFALYLYLFIYIALLRAVAMEFSTGTPRVQKSIRR